MNKFSRRDLIKAIGATALTLPLVGTSFWDPKDVLAQGATSASGAPKRFIYFFHPNGTIHDAWWPTGTQKDFEFGEILSPLTPLKSKIIIPKNLSYKSAAKDVSPGERHQSGMGTALSGRPLQSGSFVGGDGSLAGWGDGITVDQVIANHISEGTAYKSLHLGVRTDTTAATAEVRTRISYSGPAQPIPPQNDPADVFQQVFGNFTPTPSDGEVPVTEDPKIRRRRSVLDQSMEQFDFVMKKAGKEDQIRLEAHRAMVRDLEKRLSNPNVQGEACYIPDKPEELIVDSEDTMPEISRLQIDLMVAALACDQTRVASIQYSNSKNHIRFPWIESLGDGHQLSHSAGGGTAREEWIKRDNWFASEFAYLLQRLDSIREGEGTLLDNCVIVWINELSEGPRHSHTNMPFVIAGGGGGYFKTGQYVDYVDRPHNDMLVSFQNAFGIESETFGDPRFVTGPLSDIT